MDAKLLTQIQWDKLGGLIPAIAQDIHTNAVLMLAFVNQQALEKTLESGYAHYFSRSRAKLWKKGEQSKHVQKVHQILLDCDKDSLIYQVEQTGPACHTGNKTCFFTPLLPQPLQLTQPTQTPIQTLYQTILSRKNANAHSSYTASLFQKGPNTIGKKIAEEAAELTFALKDNNKEEIIHEAADLIYHSLVGLALCDIELEQITSELKRRFNQSGLEEKKQRKA